VRRRSEFIPPWRRLRSSTVATGTALVLVLLPLFPAVVGARTAGAKGASLRVIVQRPVNPTGVPRITIHRVRSTFSVVLNRTTTLRGLPLGEYVITSPRKTVTREGARGVWPRTSARIVIASSKPPAAPVEQDFQPFPITSNRAGVLSAASRHGYCPGAWNAKGDMVFFCSLASGLVPGVGGHDQVFAKSPATGAITVVSSTTAGVAGNGESIVDAFGAAEDPSAPGSGAYVSADGDRVLFESSATNLVAGTRAGDYNVFLKTLSTGTVTLVSSAADGTPAVGISDDGVLSPDGARVLFWSEATNLGVGAAVSAGTAGHTPTGQWYVKTLATGGLIALDTASDGTPGNGEVIDNPPSWSPDGKQIAFTALATNLGGNASDRTVQAWVKTVATGQLQVIGAVAASPADTTVYGTPSWSADSSKVILELGSLGSPTSEWALWTRANGSTVRVHTDVNSQPVSPQGKPQWSPDGTYLLFRGSAGGMWLLNLVTGALKPMTGGNARDSALMSPDGSRIASITTESPTTGSLFVTQIATGRVKRITDAQGHEQNAVSSLIWSPDSRRIAFFAGDLTTQPTIAILGAKNVDTISSMFETASHPVPTSWSPDARTILFSDYSGATFLRQATR
jgi:Tol biopolymer transport system component